MMKKVLLGFALSFGLLFAIPANTSAQINWNDGPPPPLQGWCNGSGSLIQYNKMPWSQMWYYMNTDDWISKGELENANLIITNGCSPLNSVDASVESTSGFNDPLTREENFITGRKCISNCGSPDPLHDQNNDAPDPSQPKYNFTIQEPLNVGEKIRY